MAVLTERTPGTPILHVDEFTHGKTTALRRIEFVPPPEIAHAGVSPSSSPPAAISTSTTPPPRPRRTPNNGLAPDRLPADFTRRRRSASASTKARAVRLRSQQGEAELPVQISDHVKPGEVYTTFHNTRVFLNQITTSHRDRYTKTPEYKVTAVNVAKLAAPAEREESRRACIQPAAP